MKHILITGGSDGLGKVTAAKLIQAGHNVTILSNEGEAAQNVAAELGCSFIVADVTDFQALQAAVSGRQVDILINNAGIWTQGLLEDNDPKTIERVIQVNTIGVINMTKAVVEQMKQRGAGRIINVVSLAGLTAKSERSVYSASKWAITGFTKSMQLELQPSKVSVTGFHPAALKTRLFERAGVNRDMSNALDPEVAADALAYICNLPEYVVVPEFGMQSIDY